MSGLVRVELEDGVARKLMAAFEGSPWEGADLMLELWPADQWSNNKSNTGLYNSIENARQRLYEDYGFDKSTATLRNARATAEAWPHAARAACATYAVHFALRGQDRRAQMDKYLYLAEQEGRKVLTRDMVTRFREDEKPRRVHDMRADFAKGIEAAAKRVLLAGITATSDFWGDSRAITQPQRDMAVTELRALATRLENKS